MLGAIAGDVIGSVHEGAGTKTKDFPLFVPESTFTDDTVLTVAVAESLLRRRDYVDALHDYFRAYPNAGYGFTFFQWCVCEGREPYNSWGNGSAMRVSAVAYARDTLEDVLEEAKRSAEVTHNHEHGIRGAQATAAAIFLARSGSSKEQIRRYIEETFDYFLDETLADLRPTYQFDVSCQGSVPQSIIAFLESNSYEDAVRNAISLGILYLTNPMKTVNNSITCRAGGARLSSSVRPSVWPSAACRRLGRRTGERGTGGARASGPGPCEPCASVVCLSWEEPSHG
jgi:ADP-ribosylglycohydrolase